MNNEQTVKNNENTKALLLNKLDCLKKQQFDSDNSSFLKKHFEDVLFDYENMNNELKKQLCGLET